MGTDRSLWDLVGGLGIFLFGMLVFEDTIAHLGKGFLKRFLEKNTNTRIKSILTGIIQTCIFQSSTIVTMMTLGFVGAGVIGLSNALGVVIGANIGTTLTPWLVTFLGFKIDIESFALPMIGIGGLATIVFSKSEKVMNIAKFIIGFGLLFLGLSYMKESVETLSQSISLDAYSHFSIRGYVLIGTIITAIMQTSTGATVITLTALSAKVITLDMALGIVIGANLGSALTTTIMGVLSSTPTQTQKKKVALSHLIFNITTTLVVTLGYPWIKEFIIKLAGGPSNEILLLSIFHTTFNIILAVLWTPFLGPLLQFLQRLVPARKSDLHLAIDHINTVLPEEVLHAIEKDTIYMLEKVEQFNRHVLYLDHIPHYPQKTHEDYVLIKQIEDRLLKYIISSHSLGFPEEVGYKIHILNDIIMQASTSGKNMKDIQHHIINIKDESVTHDILSESMHFFQEMMEKTSQYIAENKQITDDAAKYEFIENSIKILHSNDDHYLETMTTKRDNSVIESVNISEVIRTNRYILLACEGLLKSHMDYIKK